MDDFTFDFVVNVGRCFVWNPDLQYVGGIVHRLLDVDPDSLSYYEIRDICFEVGSLIIPSIDLE